MQGALILAVAVVCFTVVSLGSCSSRGQRPVYPGEESARIRCRANLVAQNWCVALDACIELARLVPGDVEALSGITTAKAGLCD